MKKKNKNKNKKTPKKTKKQRSGQCSETARTDKHTHTHTPVDLIYKIAVCSSFPTTFITSIEKLGNLRDIYYVDWKVGECAGE
jgi:hypothetical protein